MPYFLLTLKVKKKKAVQVIREYHNKDIEYVYRFLFAVSKEQYGNDLQDFDCMMISRHSETFKSLHRRRKFNETAPGKTI